MVSRVLHSVKPRRAFLRVPLGSSTSSPSADCRESRRPPSVTRDALDTGRSPKLQCRTFCQSGAVLNATDSLASHPTGGLMGGSDKRKQSLYFPEEMLREIQE